MGKNVVDNKSQNISVQDEMYKEILIGFNDLNEKPIKNQIKLSTIQKVRFVEVTKHFLKSEDTKYFTETWVKNLQNNIDIDVIKQRIGAIIQGYKNNEEEDDVISDEDEKKNKPFDIFSLLRVYNALSTLSKIVSLYSSLKRINEEHKSLSEELSKLDDKGYIGQKIKTILLMAKLQDFLYSLMTPIMGQLCETIFTYYDTKLIPKIAEKIEKFKDEAEKAITKGGVGLVPIVGGFLAGAWDFVDAGVALAKGEVEDAAFYAGSAALGIGGQVASEFAYVTVIGGIAAQATIAASKVALTYARIRRKIQKALTISEEEQKELRRNIFEIREENIVPIVNTMNEKLNKLESDVNNMESHIYDEVSQFFDISGRLREGVETVGGQINVVARITNRAKTKYDESNTISSVQTSGVQAKSSSGLSQMNSVIRRQGQLSERMRHLHSMKYNFYVEDENLDKLIHGENALYGLKETDELIPLIEKYFGGVYDYMFGYFESIISQYDTNIDQIVNGSKKIKVKNKEYNFIEITNVDFLKNNVYKKINELDAKRSSGVTSSQRTSSGKSSNKNITNITRKRKIWSLSNQTLRPFIPYFNEGYIFSGFQIRLRDTTNEEQTFEVNLGNIDFSNFNFDVKSKKHNAINYFDYLISTNTNGRIQSVKEMKHKYDTYVKLHEMIIARSKKDNKLLCDWEKEIEEEINETVIEFYNNLKEAML